VGCSTNGYFSPEALKQAAQLLDFINIGVKGITGRAYTLCGGTSFQPVREAIEFLHGEGVHVEVSIPHHRYNWEEIEQLALFLPPFRPPIPLHPMRFIPLEEVDTSWEPSIYETEELCHKIRKFHPYVYAFNCPGSPLAPYLLPFLRQ